MSDEGKIKGRIPYPCHKKKYVVVFNGAHGEVTNPCPKCGTIARFNYDTMTAVRDHMIPNRNEYIV